MKKIICAVVISTLLFACTNPSAQKEQIENDNIKFYTKVWEVAVNEGKINILDTAYASDVVLHTVPEIKGKDSAKAYYANYVTGFSNRQFIVKEMIAKGDKIVKHWQFKGTHTGNFFGIDSTGKTVDIIGCTIAKIVNGKITEEQDFVDNYAFLQQIGILK